METETCNVRLVKVDTDNLDELIKLTVNDYQKNFVASNIYSLAEAYATVAEGGFAQPFGIYADEEPVGFLMIGYFKKDEDFIIDEVYLKDGELYARVIDDDGDDLEFMLYPIGENEFGRKRGMIKLTFGEDNVTYGGNTCKKQ